MHKKTMSDKKIPLTVIILTHRADARFKKAHASAQRADEVMVTDLSKETPLADFSAARNALMKKARHEWVLFLDSDEVIDGKSWPHIEFLIRRPSAAGVWIKRVDVFYGKALRFGETGNTWILRLVQKNKARFIRPVHEVAEVQGKTLRSNITLFHYSHPTLNEFLADLTRYAQLEAEYQNDTKLSPFFLAIKTVVFPFGKFCVNYFFRLGFLDGWRGLSYALLMSLHSAWVRVFSYENR